VIACEIRLHNPAVILVIIGTNDNSEAHIFEENMRRLVTYATENGVIPILITKADRYEGEENRNNLLIRQIAVDYQVPLLDFDLVASTLPNRGLGEDGVHLTVFGTGHFIIVYDLIIQLTFLHGAVIRHNGDRTWFVYIRDAIFGYCGTLHQLFPFSVNTYFVPIGKGCSTGK
jgi:hypothetical protein